MSSSPSHSVAYRDFAQLVRRYRRDDLLRSIAVLSAQLEQVTYGHQERPPLPTSVQSFALAGLARTAVIAGNNFRNADATVDDIARMCLVYFNVSDPDADGDPYPGQIQRMLVKIAHEQYGGQLSAREDLGRTAKLLLDYAVGVKGAPTESAWADHLGVSLETFMRVGFALYVAAVQNPGGVTRQLLSLDKVIPIFQPLSAAEALAVVDRHFAATAEEDSAWGLQWQRPNREKWSPNPLQRKPVVAAGDELIIPSPQLVISRITPSGLYFIGLEAFGTKFTNALGTVFERYVGDQLRELQSADVHGEIKYGKGNEMSCDYLVVFDECVVLVEAKTARPVLDFRTGEDDGFADAKKKLGHARDQLNTTSTLIADGHAAFADIPADRPVVRLVVTLEPFFLRHILADDLVFGDDPVPVASAHDLEVVVGTLATRTDIGERLLTALSPKGDRPGDLLDTIRDLEVVPNRIITEAWDQWATWERPRDGDTAD